MSEEGVGEKERNDNYFLKCISLSISEDEPLFNI